LTKSPIVLNCANRVQCMTLSPDGKLLAAGIPGGNPGQPGHAVVWELPEGKEKINLELAGFMVTSMAFAPDGKTLAVGGQDGANAESGVRFIDVEAGKDKAQAFGGHVNVLAFDPNTGNLATGDEKNGILITLPTDGSRVRVIDGAHGGPFGIERLAFAANGQVFISAGINAPNKFPTEIKGWETPTIKPLWTLVPFKNPVRGLTVSADGLTFAACATDGDQSLIKIVEAKTGKELNTIKGPRKEIRAVALAPEGKQVAGLYLDSIRVFDIVGGKEVSSCKTGHSAAGTGLLFTPDGSMLISASDDKTIKLWNRNALTDSAVPPADSSSSADATIVTVKGAEVGTAIGKGKRYFYKLNNKATATLIVDGSSQVLDADGKPLAPDVAFKDGNMMDLKLKQKGLGVFIVIEARQVKGQ
jgi:WD40 repeat protein